MDDQGSPRLAGNWAGLVFMVVAAVGGLWWLQSPLKSSRPQATDLPGAILHQHKPTARLWQDPFEAVLRYEREQKVADQSAEAAKSAKKHDDHDPLDLHGNNRSSRLILPVMVTGSRFVEGAEWRVRSRVAVVSGLAAAGYVPIDNEKIGYVPQPLADPFIPYEWFKPSDILAATSTDAPPGACPFQRVLVLWIAEESLHRSPLERLAQLRVRLAATANQNEILQLATCRIIGPWSSSTLRAMCDELAAANGRTYERTEIYSALATADDSLLYGKDAFACDQDQRDAAGNLIPRARLAQRCRDAKIDFHSVICTDRQLVGQLLDELKRRGIDPVRGDRIALVAEHDTFYGRALPLSFVREVGCRHESAKQTDPDTKFPWLGDENRRVRSFSYLRGLDGKLAHEDDGASAGDKESSNEAGIAKGAQARDFERPEGKSQLDYIPRLAEELKRWQGMQERNEKLKAIGILGSDVYDKLLLLQSLRERFPDAIFFTTDLDARLFHPRELKWTRNLIVASSYGLQLHPDLQRGIPPFRDGYQTAIFRATLQAVGDRQALRACCETKDQQANSPLPGEQPPRSPGDIATVTPRLFEVGQRGAHDLSVTPDLGVHPPRRTDPWYDTIWTFTWRSTLFLAFLGLAVWQLTPVPHESLSGLYVYRRWIAVAALFLVASAVAIAYDHLRLEGEPFSLFEGISIWPAELVRLAAAGLGLFFLFRLPYCLNRNRQKLTRDFLLDASEPDESPAGRESKASSERWIRDARLWRAIATWTQRRIRCGISRLQADGARGNDREIDARRLWSQYRFLDASPSRNCRAIPAALAYAIAVAGLVLILGVPSQPHRGNLSWYANSIALVLSVGVFILLTAYTLDATRLCKRFVDILSHSPTAWPEPLLVQWEGKLGLGRAYLDEWLDMQFLARLTDVVGRLIWYPSLVLFLIFIARNPYFDSFDWPLSLWLAFGLNTAFALCSAIMLRRAAKAVRSKELERLRFKLIAAEPQKDGPTKQIERIMDEIEKMKGGAFAPIGDNPVVHAIFLLAGGISIPALIEFFAMTY